MHTASYRDIVSGTHHSVTSAWGRGRVEFNLPSQVDVIGTLKESPNTVRTMDALITSIEYVNTICYWAC